MTTYSPKKTDIERSWHLIDADGLILGRMATEIAKLLRGKHKPTYSPHIDMGDHVVIINADKVVLSSDKANKKNRLPSLRFFREELNHVPMLIFCRKILPMLFVKQFAACCPKIDLADSN